MGKFELFNGIGIDVMADEPISQSKVTGQILSLGRLIALRIALHDRMSRAPLLWVIGIDGERGWAEVAVPESHNGQIIDSIQLRSSDGRHTLSVDEMESQFRHNPDALNAVLIGPNMRPLVYDHTSDAGNFQLRESP